MAVTLRKTQQFVPQFFICAPEEKFQKVFMFITGGTLTHPTGLVHLYNPLTGGFEWFADCKTAFFATTHFFFFAEMEANIEFK